MGKRVLGGVVDDTGNIDIVDGSYSYEYVEPAAP